MTTKKTNVTNLNEKIISWLDKNRDLAGERILCIGTGPAPAQHLAHLFPGSSVVCLLDPEQDIPENRSEGLNEPLFLHEANSDYEGGYFDTVIYCAESALKSVIKEDNFLGWERGTLYLKRASMLMECYGDDAHALCKHLQKGGTLLALVRSGHDEYLLGFCFALAAEGLAIDPSSVRQILCKENGERTELQCLSAQEGSRTDIHALVAENLNFSLDRMNTAAEELHGREAELLLQADVSDLIRGYHIYKGNRLMGKLAVYSSIQRKDVLYYFTDVEGDEPYLKRFHTQDKEKVIRHMVGELHRQRAADKSIEWVQLELQDDWSETEM